MAVDLALALPRLGVQEGTEASCRMGKQPVHPQQLHRGVCRDEVRGASMPEFNASCASACAQRYVLGVRVQFEERERRDDRDVGCRSGLRGVFVNWGTSIRRARMASPA